MSGGVDSSVAAALLAEAGHELIGVTLHLWDASGSEQVGRCCAPEDREDARRTCDALGIPHYVLDARDEFLSQVVDPFVEDNLRGVTPVPCVRCNQSVKLERLCQLATRFGATRVATGHYARVARGDDGRVALRSGLDAKKDQSYFLFGLSQETLSSLMFPLGEMTKDDTRRHGARLGVPNWDKPDSQELCFVPDGDVAGFVGRRSGRAGRRGSIVDEDGAVLGQHAGIEGFTVGQRRGIGVSGPAARYVLRVIAESDALVVGSADRLLARGLSAGDAHWIDRVPPPAPFPARVRIRHRHEGARATIEPSRDGFRAIFDQPQRAVAPGQAAVIYRGDQVVGGGLIRSAL